MAKERVGVHRISGAKVYRGDSPLLGATYFFVADGRRVYIPESLVHLKETQTITKQNNQTPTKKKTTTPTKQKTTTPTKKTATPTKKKTTSTPTKKKTTAVSNKENDDDAPPRKQLPVRAAKADGESKRDDKKQTKKTTKRGPSGYNLFVKERRQSISKHSELSFREQSVAIGQAWGSLNAEDKARYNDMAKEMKEEAAAKQHEDDDHEAEDHHSDAEGGGQGDHGDNEEVNAKPAKKKVATRKKRAPSAYNFFCTAFFKEHEPTKLGFKEASKEASARWKVISAKERQVYEDQAKAAKEELERNQVAARKSKHEEEDGDENDGHPTTESAAKKKVKSKRSPSAYQLFCNDKRSGFKDSNLKFGEINRELAKLWKAAEGDEREPYVIKATELKQAKLLQDEEDQQGKASQDEASKKRKMSESVEDSDAEVTTPKKKKKTTKATPTKKRALSGYAMFRKEMYPKLKEEGLGFAEIAKEIGARWKSLTPKKVGEYKVLAEVANEVGFQTPTKSKDAVDGDEAATSTVKKSKKKSKSTSKKAVEADPVTPTKTPKSGKKSKKKRLSMADGEDEEVHKSTVKKKRKKHSDDEARSAKKSAKKKKKKSSKA